MDWELAIERNRTALLRIVAVMLASVGAVPGDGSVPMLRRAAYLAILCVLRPAEAAARRLIVIYEARRKKSGRAVSPRAKRAAPTAPIPKGDGKRLPLFPLFDPRKQVVLFGERKRKAKGPGPRMFFFDGSDAAIEEDVVVSRSADDLIDAGRLERRVQALLRALEDLPAQARRLARVQARRRAAGEAMKRTKPLRGGRPPGFRARGHHDVDEVLSDCHQLALMALAAHDTS